MKCISKTKLTVTCEADRSKLLSLTEKILLREPFTNRYINSWGLEAFGYPVDSFFGQDQLPKINLVFHSSEFSLFLDVESSF